MKTANRSIYKGQGLKDNGERVRETKEVRFLHEVKGLLSSRIKA